MKRKGITIWEEHLERIVLGVAVLFVIGFGGWQLLRSPNVVEQGGRTIGPGTVDEQLIETAERIRSRLAPTAPPTIDIPDHEDRAGEFVAQLDEPVAPVLRITPTDRVVSLGTDSGTTTGVLFVEPTLPAPTTVAVQTGFDALQPSEVTAVDGLPAAVLEFPHDIRWNTVGAVMDLAAVRAEFERTGPDDRRPIPPNWYRNRLEVLDVVIEREEFVGDEWTNRTVIDPEPGRVDLRGDLARANERDVRDRIVTTIDRVELQRDIVQPEFYETVQGSWLGFDPRSAMDEEENEDLTEEARRILRERRVLEDYLRRRARLAGRLTELGGNPPPPPGFDEQEEEEEEESPGGSGGAGGDPNRPGGLGGGGGRRPGGGEPIRPPGSGGLGAGGGEDNSEEKRRQEQIEDLTRQIENLDNRIRRAQRTLRGLGYDPNQVDRPDENEAGGNPLVEDELVVWGHDLEIEPGAMYRYRVRVDFYNPFFRRKLDLLEAQHPLADAIALSSAWSGWSDPQRTIEDVAVYVTAADPGAGQMGLGEVTAEVFRFTAGRWWRETFNVEPGQSIGQVRTVGRRDAPGGPTEVDFTTPWHVADVLPRPEAGRAERDSGLGGLAVLRRNAGADELMRQDPTRTRMRSDRERLIDAVRSAEERALEDAVGQGS